LKHIKTERAQQRGYSPAVITEGGRIVWLAGQTGTVDESGKSLAGDFEGQARQIFKALDATLRKAGGHARGLGTDDRIRDRCPVWRATLAGPQGDLRR
jgi:enamine deaminase RidA (YjgF/YER057c/UK114 family)